VEDGDLYQQATKFTFLARRRYGLHLNA
jgi:hypothetical protein